MKKTIILSVFIFFSFTSKADYSPLKLYEMIIKADKIVYGTISALDSSYFTLQLEGSLTSDKGELRIKRFHNWTGASRWVDYQVGQKIFLFLVRSQGELMVMSGGNEGELPIVNKQVYIHGFSLTIPPPPPPPGKTLRDDLVYFETTHFNINNGDYYGIKWNLTSFLEAVSYIRKCFHFTYGKYRKPSNWQLSCNKAELEDMCKKSKLVRWVHDVASKSE